MKRKGLAGRAKPVCDTGPPAVARQSPPPSPPRPLLCRYTHTRLCTKQGALPVGFACRIETTMTLLLQYVCPEWFHGRLSSREQLVDGRLDLLAPSLFSSGSKRATTGCQGTVGTMVGLMDRIALNSSVFADTLPTNFLVCLRHATFSQKMVLLPRYWPSAASRLLCFHRLLDSAFSSRAQWKHTCCATSIVHRPSSNDPMRRCLCGILPITTPSLSSNRRYDCIGQSSLD